MTTLNRPIDLALKASFVLALIVTLIATLVPMPAPTVAHGDKVEHFAAFYVLTLLGAAAFQRRALLRLALGLSAYGAGIEILQGLPFFNRSADFADWMSDSIGILMAIAPMLLAKWRMSVSAQ